MNTIWKTKLIILIMLLFERLYRKFNGIVFFYLHPLPWQTRLMLKLSKYAYRTSAVLQSKLHQKSMYFKLLKLKPTAVSRSTPQIVARAALFSKYAHQVYP